MATEEWRKANQDKLRAYRRKHYYANRDQYYERNKQTETAKKEYIRAQKDQPCADCGQKFHHVAMDFDHVRGEKLKGLATMHYSSWQKIKDEIAKCDVVCSNCHRIRTYKRQQKPG